MISQVKDTNERPSKSRCKPDLLDPLILMFLLHMFHFIGKFNVYIYEIINKP